MKRVHYIDNYLIDPQHPVTVNLIGAGGTGSQVLTCLARLDVTLRALGHPGLSVTLYDPDIVSGTNIGRRNASLPVSIISSATTGKRSPDPIRRC